MEENPKKITAAEAWNRGVRLGEDRIVSREIIAARLREIRNRRGYKQIDIADKTDLNAVTYGGYENGISTPHISVLIRIANVYGVSLDYLAGRTDNEKGLYAETHEKEVSERLSELEAAVKRLENK